MYRACPCPGLPWFSEPARANQDRAFALIGIWPSRNRIAFGSGIPPSHPFIPREIQKPDGYAVPCQAQERTDCPDKADNVSGHVKAKGGQRVRVVRTNCPGGKTVKNGPKTGAWRVDAWRIVQIRRCEVLIGARSPVLPAPLGGGGGGYAHEVCRSGTNRREGTDVSWKMGRVLPVVGEPTHDPRTNRGTRR